MIPMYFVFNHALIIGGDFSTLVWDAFLLTSALVAFAAVFEGYMYTWIRWPNRILIGVGMVLVFFPDATYELLGAALIIIPLAINFMAAKRANAQPVAA